MASSKDSFGTRGKLEVGGRALGIYRLATLAERAGLDVARLPFSLKILLENLLRHEDGLNVTPESIEALASWAGTTAAGGEARESARRAQIAFSPARILMQDFTGVPVVADLAAMRDAMVALGGDPEAVQPQVPAELVIDHSIIADFSARPDALARNSELEFARNQERYKFLRWGQQAFRTLKVVPPNTGICHQVNLEHLARVVFDEGREAFPDTLLGTDSHTTMVNGLSVLGWGVGGIEAEAAMLGEPVTMLVPDVVGFKLTGELAEGSTATDLVLTVTELLRKHGVVGKFVEFYGDGVARVALYNRATIGNMSPEYGSTCAIFPIDQQTLRYMRFTGRSPEHVALVEAYAKEQGLWHDPGNEPVYSEHVELDLASVEPSLAGPARPQDRVPLRRAKVAFGESLAKMLGEGAGAAPRRVPVGTGGHEDYEIGHGDVVIAAITSCTNTSNPEVMVAAGLLAKHAVERGLAVKPWVKTSLAPGSKVVMDYYDRAGLTPYLEKLGFGLVGFGCTTCIGNSGPLLAGVSEAVAAGNLAVVSVLSGNRNFEGRINPDVRMNYLASPPLVVAYALAGTMDCDITSEPLGTGADGQPVHLADVWPTSEEVASVVSDAIAADMFEKSYSAVFRGDERWAGLDVPQGEQYSWGGTSTYVRRPPYFDAMPEVPAPVRDIRGARALARLGDSVTTDHISPAGNIRKDGPAGAWLVDNGVEPPDFNSYGSRRGNHEVMVRGTFANIRLRNQLAPGTEGGFTTFFPTGEQTTIYDAAMRYQQAGTPLVVLAGKEYGSGSSRDWAAKGTALLGVRAVLAESFERIHRSNLVGMGILPLQFLPGDSAEKLGLTGSEVFDIEGLEAAGPGALPSRLTVRAGDQVFEMALRVDTPVEADYFSHGGILPFVLRQLCKRSAPSGEPGGSG
ncbi:MAG TPA: aconitate hydratase AcnA [Acidimicrobiales bacterium]|nr:aconitate hydratase AcnA [Acidimicrobiales bacterium]